MAWRKPGILVLANQRMFGIAEMFIKDNRCAVHLQMDPETGDEYFVLRKGNVFISPHYQTLTELCSWVIQHQEDIIGHRQSTEI